MLQKILLVWLSATLSLPMDNHLIDWDASRKLEWSDFTGTPDRSSTNAALTNSSITVDFGYDKSGLKHSIKCRFNKKLSWVKIKNDHILNHEQGHFNLAEVHARKLHKALEEYVFKSATVSADLNDISGKVIRQHEEMQRQYDQQTNHSLNPEQQKEWDEKISSLLEEYRSYASYH